MSELPAEESSAHETTGTRGGWYRWCAGAGPFSRGSLTPKALTPKALSNLRALATRLYSRSTLASILLPVQNFTFKNWQSMRPWSVVPWYRVTVLSVNSASGRYFTEPAAIVGYGGSVTNRWPEPDEVGADPAEVAGVEDLVAGTGALWRSRWT